MAVQRISLHHQNLRRIINEIPFVTVGFSNTSVSLDLLPSCFHVRGILPCLDHKIFNSQDT
jgi:hypothetical protein